MTNGWTWPEEPRGRWAEWLDWWTKGGWQPPQAPQYVGRGVPDWGPAGMPQYVRRGPSLPPSPVAGGRGTPGTIPAGYPQHEARRLAEIQRQAAAIQRYTPSQGFAAIPYGGIQGPYATRATPGTIPTAQTPAGRALADAEAITAAEAQQTPGPWGGQMGRYPIPNITWNIDPRLAEWEQWSWSERGIPLQGYEFHRLSRNFFPWGGPMY